MRNLRKGAHLSWRLTATPSRAIVPRMDWWWLLYAVGAAVAVYGAVAVIALFLPDHRPAFVTKGGDYFPAEPDPKPQRPRKRWRITILRRRSN
jgi:hypothetical protein